MILLNLSLANWEYLMNYQPLNTRYDNQLEIFDELSIFMVQELNFILLDTSVDPVMRSLISWCIIFLSSSNIIFHLMILIFDTGSKLSKEYLRWKNRRQQTRELLQRLEANKQRAREDPETKSHLMKPAQLYEAIQFVKTWWKEREWLLQNGVDVANFPQEIEYRRCYSTVINQSLKQYEFMKGVEHAVEQKVEAKIQAKVNNKARKPKILEEQKDLGTIPEETEKQHSSLENIEKLKNEAMENLIQSNLHVNFKEQLGIYNYQFSAAEGLRRRSPAGNIFAC